jgi:hypothetical protein
MSTNPDETQEVVAQEETQPSALEQALAAANEGKDLTKEQTDAILEADDEMINSLIKKGETEKSVESDGEVSENTKTEETLVEKKEEFNLGEKYANVANEKNTLEQKLNNMTRHEERLKNDPEYAKKYFADLGLDVPQEKSLEMPEGDDAFSPDFIKELVNEVRSTKEELKSLKAEKQEETAKTQAELALEKTYDDLDKLGNEVPELKIDGGFKKAHTEYSDWYQRMESTGAGNVKKYIEDENFRESADRQGFKMPMELSDYNKLEDLYAVIGTRKRENIASVRAAYRASDVFDKILGKRESKAVQDGEAIINEKLKEVESKATVLDTTSAQNSFETEMKISQEEAAKLLDADPRTLTQEQRQKRTDLMNKLTILD